MRILDECVNIARRDLHKHTADAFRHWSFVCQNNKILEWGRNKLNDPVGFNRFGYKDTRHSMHSEPVALRKAYGLLDRRKAWTMVNIRLGAAGELRISAPCSICRAFIVACGCTKCYFTISEGFASCEI